MVPYYVYILANKRNGTLYIGVTNSIARRTLEHRESPNDSFTRKYGTTMLVYVEPHEQITNAIQREKQLKNWRRAWKLDLIEKDNPDWRDLFNDFNR